MKPFLPYIALIAFLVALSFVGRALLEAAPGLSDELDFKLFVLGGLFFVAYFINRVAPRTAVPSFVWAIFGGMALQPLLSGYTQDISSLKVVMEILAALVLFAGGLEIPFRNFQRWFFPIASLSLLGVVLSALFFGAILYFLVILFGVDDVGLFASIVILSAALASTDPTAIIPTLKSIRFKRKYLRQIAISESALTDVSGSILTRFLILAVLAVAAGNTPSVVSYLGPLITKSTYDALALQIMTGIIVGYLGFALVKRFYSGDTDSNESRSDPALLLSVPIFTYVLGNLLGGAGFLAAFVAGLLADAKGSLGQANHFYEGLLNHLVKPFIFIFLGALVPITTVLNLAPLGIIAALMFMLAVRPLVVFISLLPWTIKGQFQLRDLIFLSFVRETGIIAAVLLIIASSYSVIQADFVIAIGMWVILLTLMLEPPLTPLLARLTRVADKPRRQK